MLSIALLVVISTQDQPYVLERHFTPGIQKYQFTGTLNLEVRETGLETFLPETTDITYSYSFDVKEVMDEGNARVVYHRPMVTETTDFSGEAHTNHYPGDPIELIITPTNDVIEIHNIKRGKPKTGKRVSLFSNLRMPELGLERQDVMSYKDDVQRLALGGGSVFNDLELTPQLPLDPVKVGDTWKRTVGFQPQALTKGPIVVQRLDYLYTYKGLMTVNGKQVRRVTADLNLNTDLGKFVNQFYSQDASGVKSIPLNLKMSILFDLDPTTNQTLKVSAESTGNFAFIIPQKERPVEEERFKGRTTITLVR